MSLLPACGITDFGCLAGEAAGSAFDAIVKAIGKGVVTMVKFLSTFWIHVPSPQVATGSGSSWMMDAKIAQLQAWMMPVTATIAICSFAIALGRMAWAGDFREGQGAVRQVAAVAAGSLVVTAIAQVLISFGDAFSPWVIEQATAQDASKGMETLIGMGLKNGDPGTESGLWFVMFILCLLGALMQCIFMVVRGPVLWVLMAFVPPTAAGTASPEGWARFKRLGMIIIAFAAYKPVAAIVYAAGLLLMTQHGSTTTSGSNDVGSAVYGLAIMVLGALALPALVKFLVPLAATGSSSAFSGGAAVGAIAGGAAILATAGAGGAGAAAAAAGPAGAGTSAPRGTGTPPPNTPTTGETGPTGAPAGPPPGNGGTGGPGPVPAPNGAPAAGDSPPSSPPPPPPPPSSGSNRARFGGLAQSAQQASQHIQSAEPDEGTAA